MFCVFYALNKTLAWAFFFGKVATSHSAAFPIVQIFVVSNWANDIKWAVGKASKALVLILWVTQAVLPQLAYTPSADIFSYAIALWAKNSSQSLIISFLDGLNTGHLSVGILIACVRNKNRRRFRFRLLIRNNLPFMTFVVSAVG